MAEGAVRFTLDDGEKLVMADADLRRIYDTLWELAKEPGAVSAAALLMDARRVHPYIRRPIDLTTPQSTVLRKAVALLQTPQ